MEGNFGSEKGKLEEIWGKKATFSSVLGLKMGKFGGKKGNFGKFGGKRGNLGVKIGHSR